MREDIENITSKKQIHEFEFIALMAFLMSNVALSIDAILPALTDIGVTLMVTDSTSLQLIISMIFIGLGIGEIILGTLSDSLGRRPVVYFGVGLFIIASVICLFSYNLEMMLSARVLQGIGLAALRTVSVSIIRDSYSGDKMARIMSFIMGVFILVPMIAPILGQMILRYFDWQAIFYFQLVFVLITIFWFSYRQKETLPKEKRIKLSKKIFINGIKEFFKFRNTVLFTLVSGLMEGAFILYLSTSKEIFQDQYKLIDEFPYVFAIISFVLGISTFFNASLVLKYGMKKLVALGLYLFSFSSLIYLLVFFSSENPPLMILLIFLFVQFASLGFIFGNLSALAMQPIGHIAGIGSAIFSFISTGIAVFLAIFIGEFITTSVVPLFMGFFISGLFSIILLNVMRKKTNES